jgi:hypothetical protein
MQPLLCYPQQLSMYLSRLHSHFSKEKRKTIAWIYYNQVGSSFERLDDVEGCKQRYPFATSAFSPLHHHNVLGFRAPFAFATLSPYRSLHLTVLERHCSHEAFRNIDNRARSPSQAIELP